MAAGMMAGKAEDILQLLGELGEVPDAVRQRVRSETDPDALGRWLKTAAKAESISEFADKMK